MSRPYNYEGNELRINNPFTGVQINQLTDGTFDFNLPEKSKNFTNFYELYRYYTTDTVKSKARVHQEYLKSSAPSEQTRTVPSFLDILGVSLILTGLLNYKYLFILSRGFGTDRLFRIFFALFEMSNSNGRIVEYGVGTPSINRNVKIAIQKEFQIAFGRALDDTPLVPLEEIIPLSITTLNGADVSRILTLFKQAIFFYRYGVVPIPEGNFTFNLMENPEGAVKCCGTQAQAIIDLKANISHQFYQQRMNLYKPATLDSARKDAEKLPALAGQGGKRTKPKKGTIKHKRTRRTRRTRRARR